MSLINSNGRGLSKWIVSPKKTFRFLILAAVVPLALGLTSFSLNNSYGRTSSEGISPPFFSSFNPFDPAQGFSVFIEGDAELIDTETEGSIAIGGDLNYYENGYILAPSIPEPFFVAGEPTPVGLLINGSVNWSNIGTPGLMLINNGFLKIGDCTATSTDQSTNINSASSSTNANKIIKVQGFDQTGYPLCESGIIDFNDAFIQMNDYSEELSMCPTNVVLRDEDTGAALPTGSVSNKVTIELTANAQNIVSLTLSQLNAINSFKVVGAVDPSINTPLVFNIDGLGAASGQWDVWSFIPQGAFYSQFVLYNFYNIDDLTINTNNTVWASVFAPSVDLTLNGSGNIEGEVAAATLIHDATEIHGQAFLPNLTGCGAGCTINASVSNPTCINNIDWSFDFTISGSNTSMHYDIDVAGQIVSGLNYGQTYNTSALGINLSLGSGPVGITATDELDASCNASNSIDPPSQAPYVDAGNNQMACSLIDADPSQNIIALEASGGTGTWSGGNNASGFNDANSAITTYTYNQADVDAGSITLTFTSDYTGSCSATSSSMTVDFVNPAVFTIDETAIVLCTNALSLDLSMLNPMVMGSNEFGWVTDGDGSFNPVTSIDPVYTFGPTDKDNGSVILTFEGNGNCGGVSQDLTITFSSLPTASTGGSVEVCDNFSEVQLGGSTSTMMGTWSGGLGQFVPNANTLNAVYIPTQAELNSGSVTLTLTSSDNGCGTESEDLVIDFPDAPIAVTSVSADICDDGVATLTGEILINGVNTGTGTWSIINGDGEITGGITNLNGAIYEPGAVDLTGANNPIIIRLTPDAIGACSGESADYEITITDLPVVTSSFVSEVCETQNVALNPVIEGDYQGWNWSSTNGTGVFQFMDGMNPVSIPASVNGFDGFTAGANNNSLNVIYILSAQDILNGSVELIFTPIAQGANCSPASAIIPINIAENPTVVAGVADSDCASDSPIQILGTTFTNASGLEWTSLTGGSFSDSNGSNTSGSSNDLEPYYVPSQAEKNSGMVKLMVQAVSSSACLNASDMVTFMLFNGVDAGEDQNFEYCGETTVVLSNLLAVAGTFYDVNNVPVDAFNPLTLPVGQTVLTYVVEGDGSCSDDSAVFTFDVTEPLSAGDDNLDFFCQPESIDLNSYLVSADLGGDWFDANGTLVTVSSSVQLSTGLNEFTYVVSPGGVCNDDVAEFIFTVGEDNPPVMICKDATIELNNNGIAVLLVAEVNNGSTDDCAIDDFQLSKDEFDCSDIGGPNTVILTATDVNGNSASCSVEVTVEDNEFPEITCPANISILGCDPSDATLDVTGIATATDNCTYTIENTSFTLLGICENKNRVDRIFTVTDASGNSVSCIQEITVEDTQAPVLTVNNIQVNADLGVCGANVELSAFATDNCSFATITYSIPSGSFFNVGQTIVSATAVDVCGNSVTEDFIVEVVDNEVPDMVCTDITVNLEPGDCGAVVTYEVIATDNCGVNSIELVSGPVSGTYLDYHDSSWTVVWEATDVNGNSSQCVFMIEMFEYDDPTPVLTCNDNLQVSLSDSGSDILGADMILEGGPYGCYDDYIVTIDGSSNELDCSMVGAGSIMVMVEDPDTGNTCWSNIIVEDKIGPDCVTVSDYTVDCEEGLPADTDPVYWPTFGDNCAVAEVNLVSETVLNSDICADITVERVWTAVDASGNTANTNCVQTITITRGSILLPTDIDFDCTNYTLEDLVPALTGFPEGGATSCGYSYTYTDAVFDGCGNTAAITRTWSILDECSSAVTTHVQLISLIDIQGPSIAYNDITVSANVTAVHPQPCLSTAIIPTNAAVSDCSDVVSVRYFTSVGEVINGSIPAPGLPIGEHTLTITAEDACGNTSSEDFTITVIDGIAPTPVCKEITQISLSTDGTAVVPAESFDNGSYDNCCLDYIEVRRMDETTFGPTVSFDCTDETVEVVLRAVDCYENDNTCMVVALVEDKLAPTCTAPADVTGVDCDVYYSELAAALANEDYSVLEVYGQGTTADNCTLVPDYTVSYNVDECGNGTITRTWTANDAAENQTAVCKQDIFIVHNSNWTVAFSAVDQVEVECSDAEIEELAPVITNDACEMIATSYTDTPFNVVGSDHCMKIFRDWTVINWCAYDSENEVAFPENDVTPLTGDITGNGYATYTQVIKVVDNTAPEVTTNDALVVSEDAEACTTDIAVADVEALFGLDSNCGDVEDYHNFGDLDPYLNDAGTTFVGVPAGTYEVSRTSVDACGNAGTAVNTVTVEPKAPTAYCTDELVIDLMVTGMAEVNAADFNFASSDNCTATGDLSYAFSSDITNTSMTVTCDNLGDNIVEMWVFDADSMTDYCVVTLTVQNNNGADCGTGTLTVAGAINTEDAEAVSEVEVEVNGGLFATTTDASGMFTFDLAEGGDYTVIPSYDVDVENGVSTFDIVKITRHILNIESLDSAYKVIAADANNSSSVTTLDVVAIRKVILQIDDVFQDNTSWRFVDAGYTFADPMNPWGFAEVVNFNNLDESALTTDFVAVKVGDVTGDAQTSFGSADDRTKNGTFAIDAKEVAMIAGNTYEVTFTADASVEGFQFTMNFDAKKVAFVGLADGVATAENFGFAKLDEGAITASWNVGAAYDFAGTEVFTVSFTALEDVNLSEAISINSRFTAAEAYAAGELQDVALTFSGSTTANYALYQNTPNPFKGETVIAFELAKAGNAVVTVMDVNGKVVRTINGDFAKGFNNVIVKDINTTGVLYYTLESGDFTATKKMIIIE